MAIVKGGVLEGTHGKVGLLVSKNRQGTQYVAALSADFHPSMEPHEIEKRDRFGANSRFSSGVNQNIHLFKIWTKSNFAPKMTYNKITQFNSKLCSPYRPTKNNVITPPGGFTFHIEKLEYYPDKVIARIESVVLNENEKRINFLLYLCLYGPLKSKIKYFDFIQIKEGKFDNDVYTFDFIDCETKIAINYKFQILFLCAVITNADGEIVRYSETNAADLGEIFELNVDSDRQTVSANPDKISSLTEAGQPSSNLIDGLKDSLALTLIPDSLTGNLIGNSLPRQSNIEPYQHFKICR